jgi:hypothetical protein
MFKKLFSLLCASVISVPILLVPSAHAQEKMGQMAKADR